MTVAARAGVGHGRDVSPPVKKSKVGPVALLGLAVALVAGYLGNCFEGVGLGVGNGAGVRKVEKGVVTATKTVGAATDAAAKARITVEGERCRLGDEGPLGACDEACKAVEGAAAEVEATAGAQHTVEALRTCLQGRGVKVQVVSE